MDVVESLSFSPVARREAEHVIDEFRCPPPLPPLPPEPSAATLLARLLADGGVPAADMADRVGVTAGAVADFAESFGLWVAFTVQGGPPVSLDDVVVPPGLSPAEVGRDIRRPLGHIQRVRPTDDVVVKWVLRSGPRIRQVLSFEVVAVTQFMAALGRLPEVRQLVWGPSGFNHGLARVVVEAYDLLESSRADAVHAVARLCEGRLGRSEFADLLDSTLWLAEAPLRRARADLDLIGGDLGVQAARSRVRSAARLAPRRLLPAWIDELNSGQVRRLCASAGIDVDRRPADFEAEARRLVAESGQSADDEVLVPHLCNALALGLADEVMSALSARANADLSWADSLNRSLARFDIV
jgi:hypothetical protein